MYVKKILKDVKPIPLFRCFVYFGFLYLTALTINLCGNCNYVPKNNIKNVEKNIYVGSIIFFTTSKSVFDYLYKDIAMKTYGEYGVLYDIRLVNG